VAIFGMRGSACGHHVVALDVCRRLGDRGVDE
jgi:hypothetical protein